MEPKFPAAIERYQNLGEYYDVPAIKAKRDEIVGLIQSKKPLNARATRCLRAARALGDDTAKAVINQEALGKIARRTRGIIAREIKKGKGGSFKKRFMSGITPDGAICRFDTARTLCERIYELSDNYGLSDYMLRPIMEAAANAGHDIIACYCPYSPERLEHLLIPSLSLGFVTSSALYPYDSEPYRRIRLDASLSAEIIRQSRQRTRFYKKTERALIDEASLALQEARQVHQKLEMCYNPHVDFSGVRKTAAEIIEELLSNAEK